MKFVTTRYGFAIAPENDLDCAFIEDTLNLRDEGEWVVLRRVNHFGLSSLCRLETAPPDLPNLERPQKLGLELSNESLDKTT